MRSEDDDYNGRRMRSSSDASSGRSGRSDGSYRRRCRPEKLIDVNRRVRGVGTAFVDNGAAISPSLTAIVSSKAFYLDIKLRNRQTHEILGASGQVGLLRGERLAPSPPSQRRALEGEDGRPTPILRSSRFSVTPVTCLHNVVSEVDDESDDVIEYVRSEILAPTGERVEVDDFARAGYEVDTADAVMIRDSDENRASSGIFWKYGHDVTTAGEITIPRNHFTRKHLSFETIERQGYRIQSGQKIGISVYRDFAITGEDVGMPQNALSSDELRDIYGRENRVNIYTGQITHVSPNGNAFEHNINTFAGCSGAVVFLLNQDQDRNGVIGADHGKAIGIHAGGKNISPGVVRNLAFSIHIVIPRLFPKYC